MKLADHLYNADGTEVSPTGGGNVTAAATLTNHALIVGRGTEAVAALGSLGTANQVYHGNASGDGTFSAIDLAADVTGLLPASNIDTGVITRILLISINGNGSTIATGIIKGADAFFDFAATITKVTMLADQSGSIVVDIWKAAYGSYPPTVTNTITASDLPTISSATKSQDSTLTGWTTSIAAGDVLRFNVNSATSIQALTLALTLMVN